MKARKLNGRVPVPVLSRCCRAGHQHLHGTDWTTSSIRGARALDEHAPPPSLCCTRGDRSTSVVAPDKFKGTLTPGRSPRTSRRVSRRSARPRVVQVRWRTRRRAVDARCRPGYDGSQCGRRGRPASRSTPPTRCATASRGRDGHVSGLRLLPRLARAAHRSSYAPRDGAGRAGPRAAPRSSSASVAARARRGSGMAQATRRPAVRRAGTTARGGPLSPRLDRIDLSGLHPAFATSGDRRERRRHPCSGPTGAAAVYGPQKGADPQQVAQLDAALVRWATRSRRRWGSRSGPAGLPARRGLASRQWRLAARCDPGSTCPRPRRVRRPPAGAPSRENHR